MATRASIFIKDCEKTIAKIYKHYAGFPTELGQTIKDFLLSRRLARGVPFASDELVFNGMDNVAALLIWRLVNLNDAKSGDVSLKLPDSKFFDQSEEFHYCIYRDAGNNFMIKVISSYYGIFFNGLLEDADMALIEKEWSSKGDEWGN